MTIFGVFGIFFMIVYFPLAFLGMPIWMLIIFYNFLSWIFTEEVFPSLDARTQYLVKNTIHNK